MHRFGLVRSTLLRWLLLNSLMLLLSGQSVRAQQDLEAVTSDAKSGATIYANQCASCHGAAGQGVPDVFPDPLHGDLSLDELTRYIDEDMPEEEPGECVGPDAKAVAKHIFEAFYSKKARETAAPSKTAFSRLTVEQYRRNVADLVSSFNRKKYLLSEQRGLEGSYFASRSRDSKLRIAKQIDPQIDFADTVPHFDPDSQYEVLKNKKGDKKSKGFSALWTGGLIPTQTGHHKIVVESQNGFRLRINDTEEFLIDRKVRSDDENRHEASVFLIAGRAHSFILEMSSYPDPFAKIRLLWKPPGQPLTTIPKTSFTPHQVPETAIVDVDFPPDDASRGFVSGTDVSAAWDSANTSAAIDVANFMASRIWKLARAKPTNENATDKVKGLCREFVSRALVAKLSDDETKLFVDQHFEQDISIEDQVKRVVLMTLKSPRFLFPTHQKRDESHEAARRAALVLWDSLPDRGLLQNARRNKLRDPNVLASELDRMVDDSRSKQKLKSFFEYWLQIDQDRENPKDQESFPKFNEFVVADLRHSLELFLDETVWSEASDFRSLFLAEHLYVNERLAKFYGLESKSPQEKEHVSGFASVNAKEGKRAGILTHPYLMTGLAYDKETSPIHRGVFIARRLLGRTLRQPPDDVEPLTEEFDPKMTTRERVEHQTSKTACMNCHSVINPLGFSLENFDAVGRFRVKEKQKPIDVTSVYRTPSGENVKINGARQLAEFLANNEVAQKSFVLQLFNYYAKQPIEAFEGDQLNTLHERFKNNDFNIRKLIIDIATVVVRENLTSKNETPSGKISRREASHEKS